MSVIATRFDENEGGASQLEVTVGDEKDEKKMWVNIPHKGQLIWSVILFIAEVGVHWNCKRKHGPKNLYQLVKGLDLSFLKAVEHTYYRVEQWQYTYSLESWVKFLFLCNLFDKGQKELLEFLRNPAHCQWLRIIGWESVPSPSRVSEFKKNVHPAILPWAFCLLRDQIYQAVRADQLSEEQVLAYAQRRTMVRPKSYVGRVGFNLFCHFVAGLGVIAELMACLSEPHANVTYRRRDIVLALLHRVMVTAKNMTQLAGVLRNKRGLGELEIAPSRVTLGEGFADFDADKLAALNQRLMEQGYRARRGQRLRVGIDSSLIEVRGEHEEAEYTIDPHTGKYIRAYKLFAACNLETKDVLYLHLAAGNASDSKQLLDAAKAVKKLVSPDPVDLIMFDKGFYKQASFNQLNQAGSDEDGQEEGQAFITPGKKYKTITDAVKAIEEEAYRLYEPELTPHQREKQARQKPATRQKAAKEKQQLLEEKGSPPMIAECMVELKDYDGALRLIVVRDKRRKTVKLKNEKGTRYLRDEEGNILTKVEWETVYYSYLTNISEDRMTPEQVIVAYKDRWCVEDLFEELKNDWGLKYFPGTGRNTVLAHIHFTFILYATINLFKHFMLTGKYARKMLCSLQIDVLQAPHAVFARWLTNAVAFEPDDGLTDTIQLLYACGHFRLELYSCRPAP